MHCAIKPCHFIRSLDILLDLIIIGITVSDLRLFDSLVWDPVCSAKVNSFHEQFPLTLRLISALSIWTYTSLRSIIFTSQKPLFRDSSHFCYAWTRHFELEARLSLTSCRRCTVFLSAGRLCKKYQHAKKFRQRHP